MVASSKLGSRLAYYRMGSRFRPEPNLEASAAAGAERSCFIDLNAVPMETALFRGTVSRVVVPADSKVRFARSAWTAKDLPKFGFRGF